MPHCNTPAQKLLAVVPELLAQSKHNINRRLTYLRGTVGLSIDDIMTQPKLLAYSVHNAVGATVPVHV